MRLIRQLASTDVECHWDREQEEALDKIGNLVTSSSVLAWFDLKKYIVIHRDDSQTEYRPGKEKNIADFLSWTHLPESEGGQEQLLGDGYTLVDEDLNS
ncbi:hypothetical protein Pmani_002740 [Petrolisthes manimaculis]|uniref:Uncharacterized protein n=1 Tax=Petrolisthes manimaculis TaxID=1843537 RepID=A0AAE1UN61_9EUCA|nr:hypothetical protein Pmani_002740 [Petrolisthes manimaculis]